MKQAGRIFKQIHARLLISVFTAGCFLLVGVGCGGGGGGSGPSAPSAPNNLNAVAGEGMMTLSWDTVNGADSYNVYWSTSDGVDQNSGTKISGVSNPFIHTTLENSTAYYYTVTAENSLGESATASEVHATTLLPAPRAVVAAAGDGKITLEWDDVAKADTYNIHWADAAGLTTANGTRIAAATSPFTLDGLENGTPYYFMVTAENTIQESSGSREALATPAWGVRLLGTAGSDIGEAIALDSVGNLYVTGQTNGSLDGNPAAGSSDIFISKYDARGNKIWTEVLGSSGDDFGRAIAVDSAGNLYVTGQSFGDLDGNTHVGGGDIFVAKYDTNGNKQWVRMLGEVTEDNGTGIGIDPDGGCYISGTTSGGLGRGIDTIVARYGPDGGQSWIVPIGGSGDDMAQGISVDTDGNFIVTGYTNRNLYGNTSKGSNDLFIVKYNASGNRLWAKLVGTASNDYGRFVTVDSAGNAYVTGETLGNLDGVANAGGFDILVVKFASNGVKQWTKLIGTAADEKGRSVAVDNSGCYYITGETESDLGIDVNAGGLDIFTAKYDPDGNEQWLELLGTLRNDIGHGIAVDAAGNCYVTGETRGDLNGNENAGVSDIFIAKYDAARQWTQLLGTPAYETGQGIDVDSNGLSYVTGFTDGPLNGIQNQGGADIFVAKYDSGGKMLWAELSGTIESEYSTAIALDSRGNFFITGHTYGELDKIPNAGGLDIFISKYDTDGKKQWTRLSGTSEDDYSFGIAVDSDGNCYLTGYTAGNLAGKTNAGQFDSFIAKYDSNGNHLWTELIGSVGNDYGRSIAVDEAGNSYIGGHSDGDFDTKMNAGESDIFVAKFDPDGNKLWSDLLGTSDNDYCTGIALDNAGHFYLSGHTDGNLGAGVNAGSFDIFITKFDTAGNNLWITLLGSQYSDISNGVKADAMGYCYVVGHSVGNLGGKANAGDADIVVASYDQNGNEQWVELYGTAFADYGFGVAIGLNGNLYTTGQSMGNFGGRTNTGDFDVFLKKLVDNSK